MKIGRYLPIVILICIGLAFATADAQENLAQQASAIFEQSCLICHGPHGSFTEELIIQSRQGLIDTGTVIPGNPDGSKFYQRLIETAVEKRMPLGQPPLPPEAIQTIRQWIQAGAPDWNAFSRADTNFITTEEMLQAIENHVQSLDTFDRAFARYFTSTHLYNAGETTETLRAYRRALSKLVNSLSWGREVIKPQPIDSQATIFYIDLRDYEWEIGTDRWTQIEQTYPYKNNFESPTQAHLHEKLTNLRQETNCEVPFIHVDWFLATASLPPLYHDILALPLTDHELEARLEVNVVENIRNAAGRRVWRAGFNDSGVSNHNRVVERHLSRYGAYWKSYDFAGSIGTQHIFTHPLNFTHDGGEIIFNLPNGLQAYYLADAGGNRLNEAPINIVSNPAASDPTVRNGLSCIGCHTEGMKDFEDQVRGVVEQNANPPYNKAQALRLYVEKTVMDGLIEEDTEHYRQALETAGGVFGGIEPIQRFHEAFQGPLDASHAAATVGLETEVFLGKVHESTNLQNLGLLVLENGTVKRDTWTEQFSEVIFALDFPEKSEVTPVVPQTERIPGESVRIPDPNLRTAIAEALEKMPNASITVEDMEVLTNIRLDPWKIRDLTGIEFATNLEALRLITSDPDNRGLISDLSPLAGLTELRYLKLEGFSISDLSPLTGLINLEYLVLNATEVSDLSPLAGLSKLKALHATHSPLPDLSPLAGLTNLETLKFLYAESPSLAPLKGLTRLKILSAARSGISDVSPLAGLINLEELELFDNHEISEASSLASLSKLRRLNLHRNNISDVSSLTSLHSLEWVDLAHNNILDISPLAKLPKDPNVIWYENPGFPRGGPKIEGPWLWAMVPGPELNDSIDFLAQASGNTVTEIQVATYGATEGTTVGESLWTPHEISPTGENNMGEMLNALGWAIGEDTIGYILYGSIILNSPKEQQTKIFVGADDRGKVWLNGELVHKKLGHLWDPSAVDYQRIVPVTLNEGANILLVAVENGWGNYSGFFGFAPEAEYTVVSPGTGFTFSTDTTSVRVGDTFTVHVNAEKFTDLAGWQFDLTFDPDVLEVVEVNEGGFLKTDGGTTFFQHGTIDNTAGEITGLTAALISEGGVTGTGTLLSVTFLAKGGGESQIDLRNFQLGSSTGEIIPAGVPKFVIIVESKPVWDVNADGQVSVLDLILVARHFGGDASANPQADVNRDGVINIQDLIIVAQHLGESTDSAAPSVIAINNGELTPAMIQVWITQAEIEDDGSIAFRQGIANLERLLTLFIPEETALLHNYPNPFNPETWIPYQLAEPAEVTLTIHSVNGTLVRTLALGHQPAGIYQTRTRAAYWDGRNVVGEPVASGIYFYTLTAGNFTATRKMLIRK